MYQSWKYKQTKKEKVIESTIWQFRGYSPPVGKQHFEGSLYQMMFPSLEASVDLARDFTDGISGR
jgi:hypothetical protein